MSNKALFRVVEVQEEINIILRLTLQAELELANGLSKIRGTSISCTNNCYIPQVRERVSTFFHGARLMRNMFSKALYIVSL